MFLRTSNVVIFVIQSGIVQLPTLRQITVGADGMHAADMACARRCALIRFITSEVPSLVWTVKTLLHLERGVLVTSVVLSEIKRLRFGVDVMVHGSLGKHGGGMKQLTDRVGGGLQSLRLPNDFESFSRLSLKSLPPSIRTLSMIDFSSQTLAGLSVLSCLQTLTLRSCSLEKLDGIEALPLRTLKLHCPRVLSIDPLSSMANLVHLELTGGMGVYSRGPFTSADALSQLTSISCLTLELNGLRCIKGLAPLTSCVKLKLCNNSALTNVDGMPSSVEDLDLSSNRQLSCIKGLAPLTSCVKLKLIYSGLTKVDGMPCSVEELDLAYSWQLSCLKGLADLTRCVKLKLYCCSTLESVDGLPVAIKDLNLSSCSSLTSVHGLTLLTCCTRLNLSYCSALEDVDPL